MPLAKVGFQFCFQPNIILKLTWRKLIVTFLYASVRRLLPLHFVYKPALQKLGTVAFTLPAAPYKEAQLLG